MTRWAVVALLAAWVGWTTPCLAQDPPPPPPAVQVEGPGDGPTAQAPSEAAPQPGRRRGKKAEEAFVVLILLPGALVLFLCPVGLALQCLILGYGPQRGRGLQLAQEGRGKTLVLGVANTGFLLLVAASAERKAPGLAGLAWAVWLSMAFVGLHGIARGIGERVLSLPAVLSGSKPLKPLALGWCLLVAASAMPIVGWCMGIYWLIRGSGTAVVALLGRKPEPLVR
ncbi:MAG: hypothetical protein KDD82_22510 [Planctomycetes bacterium]|nr:hypothetical protein [Planctomycetota bacterium]